MSRTRRRKWVWVKDSFELLNHQREKTCKPGCPICSKGWVKRALNRKERHSKKGDIEDYE